MAGGLSKPYRWLSKPRRVAAPLSRLAERGPATWPSAARSRGHVSSFNAKTRNASETFAGISGFAEPPVGIEPTTYSLRVNRSAD